MANLTRDQRIIRDNPGKDPYELLQLGISEKKYNELVAALMNRPQAAKPQPAAQPSTPAQTAKTPQKVTVVRARPQTRSIRQNHSSEMAWFVDKDGKQTYMSRQAAERRSRKVPGSKVI